MSGYVEIVGKCVCRENIELHNNFVDEEINLVVEPCKQCIEKAIQGLVYNTLFEFFQSPKYVTPETLLELQKAHERLKTSKLPENL